MSNQSQTVLGSWQVTVSTPQQGEFPALLTFMADGGLLTDQARNPLQSAGHGNWLRRTADEVAYTFVAFLRNPEGKQAGHLKVVGVLNPDTTTAGWHGPFQIEISDASGQINFTDRGTFSLTRIAVEMLD